VLHERLPITPTRARRTLRVNVPPSFFFFYRFFYFSSLRFFFFLSSFCSRCLLQSVLLPRSRFYSLLTPERVTFLWPQTHQIVTNQMTSVDMARWTSECRTCTVPRKVLGRGSSLSGCRVAIPWHMSLDLRVAGSLGSPSQSSRTSSVLSFFSML